MNIGHGKMSAILFITVLKNWFNSTGTHENTM